MDWGLALTESHAVPTGMMRTKAEPKPMVLTYRHKNFHYQRRARYGRKHCAALARVLTVPRALGDFSVYRVKYVPQPDSSLGPRNGWTVALEHRWASMAVQRR